MDHVRLYITSMQYWFLPAPPRFLKPLLDKWKGQDRIKLIAFEKTDDEEYLQLCYRITV